MSDRFIEMFISTFHLLKANAEEMEKKRANLLFWRANILFNDAIIGDISHLFQDRSIRYSMVVINQSITCILVRKFCEFNQIQYKKNSQFRHTKK